MVALCALHANLVSGQDIDQDSIEFSGPSFIGRLHGNISNEKRQGSGLSPLEVKPFLERSVFRSDAVGVNFEHVFDGSALHRELAMFTPREDRCVIRSLDDNRLELRWPAADSSWKLDARMIYDFTHPDQIDLSFECTPRKDLFPHDYFAMMWASYMNRTVDRRIHFWGVDGETEGWQAFGEGTGNEIEVGTVACIGVENLKGDEGAQLLNVTEHPTKRFLTPFYYGLIDGDHDLSSTDDRLMFLVLFDQCESIRFAMWNFYKNEQELPDTHSPAWDWQFVVRDPEVNKRYNYRARIVIKPFTGKELVWKEYEKWQRDIGIELPEAKRTR